VAESAVPGGSILTDYRCASCGYGVAVVLELPTICPMCRGATWDRALWRPFSRRAAESLEIPLTSPQANSLPG
jgi:hypothetical protein